MTWSVPAPEQTLLSPWPARAVSSRSGSWDLTAVAFPKQISAAFGNAVRPRDLAPHKKKKQQKKTPTNLIGRAAAANAPANTLLSMSVCLFTGLLASACVCLSRFSLFSPLTSSSPPASLFPDALLFALYLCLLRKLVGQIIHQKSATLLSTLRFFQSIPLTLKPKESLGEKKTGNFWDSFLPVSPFCQESFQLNVVKMDFHWLVSGWKKIELCVHNPEPRTVQVQKQWGEG